MGLKEKAVRRHRRGLEFLPDEGEAARLIREFDWSATPLGPRSQWSAALRMVVRFVLANRFPMLLWWGPEYIQIYNDAYSPILGTKHPDQAMGKPFKECWHEVYNVLGPLVDTPFSGGEATWMEDIELVVRRHGFPEESHFTIAYSPVPDDTAPRGIGGVLATVHEITQKVIGERRVKILSELSAAVAGAKTDVEACVQAIATLSQHPKDIPFALMYLVDDARKELVQVGMTGITADVGCPVRFDLESPMNDVAWPLREAIRSESMQFRDGFSTLLPSAPQGPWPDPPTSVAVVPIKSSVAHRLAGALVAGLSACIRRDALYTSFLELVGSQIAAAIANARAYDEERRRAEGLLEIDRAKTAFFSNVSHEFRTPLTLMLGPLDDALAVPEVSAPVRGHLELAKRNAERLQKLVNSLLDFARIEAGRIDASFVPVDLSALTEDLCSTFRSAMESAKLEYEVACEPLAQPVYVDREMWEKIVLNLLSNAFKFTLEGKVRVGMTQEDANAVFEVADTGIGVPEHEIPRLFERFHRVEGTNARTHEGSGIGLALVQELVKFHGGSIELRSQLGQGTTFRVRIPFGAAHIAPRRIEASPSRASTAVAAKVYVEEALRWLPDNAHAAPLEPFVVAEASSGKDNERFASTFGSRVLLADDNTDMRIYVRELLGPHYVVEGVVDGEQALDAAERTRPDLILADVMMPRLDGFGLLAAVRADPNLRDVPVILVSARAGEESRIEGLGAGADDYVVKPFHARELLARVGALLELTRVRRESDERFRAFIQASSYAIYRMSPDWKEMRQLEGRNFIPDQATPNRTWIQKYVHEEDRADVMVRIEASIRTKTPFELEHRVIRADGTPGWTLSRAVPLHDDDGNIIEWFGAAADVTVRHEAQQALRHKTEQLEEESRQKNVFLAMLAHELRNPLAPIRNAGELLSRMRIDDPQANQALAIVERQINHLTRLVDDLLDVSRITQGRIELRRSVVRLDKAIAQAVETIEPVMRAKRHKIGVVTRGNAIKVNADPQRLIQCIGNILANAAKYTASGGEIFVETEELDGMACITVRDNGSGIAADLLPKVFDLFVQGERTLDRAQGGLGIGLSIVKRLVEMHGGSVAARSAGLEQGATFELRLPVATDPEPKPTIFNEHNSAPYRILVVDDNQDGAHMLAELLRLDGHDVETALSGSEALARLASFRPQVALLDLGLPGLDGYEIARRIRAERCYDDVRLVAITGYGAESDRKRTREASFIGHLVKPVDFTTVQRLLAELE